MEKLMANENANIRLKFRSSTLQQRPVPQSPVGKGVSSGMKGAGLALGDDGLLSVKVGKGEEVEQIRVWLGHTCNQLYFTSVVSCESQNGTCTRTFIRESTMPIVNIREDLESDMSNQRRSDLCKQPIFGRRRDI
jgi:hypothetical protein